MKSFTTRRFVSALLLVVYGTAGVLGYGLHAFWHHHHDAGGASTGISQLKADSACSHCSWCSHSHKPSRNNESFQQPAEDCSICAFLAQAQTPVFEFTQVQIVSELGCEVPVSESMAPLFIPTDHLARGPPLG